MTFVGLLDDGAVVLHERERFEATREAGLEPAYVPDAETRCGWTLRDIPERIEGYRMPLRHEWEYAARGGAEAGAATLYAGGNVVDDVASTGNTDGLQPVGRKKPNALGIHDMSGLLNEWVDEGDLLGGSYWYPATQVGRPLAAPPGVTKSPSHEVEKTKSQDSEKSREMTP